jgi:hypothetical protein
MRLILLRSTCGETRTCPNINATGRGTYVVQGYLVTGLDLGGHMLGPGDGFGARSPRRGGGCAAGVEPLSGRSRR